MSLDKIMRQINREQGEGTIGFNPSYREYKKIPFSSPELNYITYGGLPTGRIHQIAGENRGGKTTLALDLTGNFQRMENERTDGKKRYAIFIDAENTLDRDWAEKMGVNMEELILYKPVDATAEEILQKALDLMETGEVGLIVIDSIGVLFSDQQDERDIGEKTYAGISNVLTTFSKKAIQLCARQDATIIGINQIRDNLNSAYGGKITTGGNAWAHAISVNLWVRLGQYIDSDNNTVTRSSDNVQGNLIEANLKKNKVAPLDRQNGTATLNYIRGLDIVHDALLLGEHLGYVHRAGAWYSLSDPETGEIIEVDGKEVKGQGINNFKDKLEELNLIDDLVGNINKEVSKVEV